MATVRNGELLAREAQYQKDRLIEEFRAANLGYCAYALSTNPSEDEASTGEFYGQLGDSLRTAIAITIEHPEPRQARVIGILHRLSALVHRGPTRISPLALDNQAGPAYT